MDKVIETLNTIEERAARITQATLNEKDALKESYDQKASDYERMVEKETATQLKKLHDDMDMRIQETLSTYENNSKKERMVIRDYYKDHHEQLANEIFHSIVGE